MLIWDKPKRMATAPTLRTFLPVSELYLWVTVATTPVCREEKGHSDVSALRAYISRYGAKSINSFLGLTGFGATVLALLPWQQHNHKSFRKGRGAKTAMLLHQQEE